MEVCITLPETAEKILDTLHSHGHSAFIVGGCVRDSLLGRIPYDWDICTSACPTEIEAAFPGCCMKDQGIRHGTVSVVQDGTFYEVTTFRTESCYSDHRHPDKVCFVRDIYQDLQRRDFTVNAMAYSPDCGLVDPFHGAQDLAAKTLRCVGDADHRFSEDALRILRMMRFWAVLGFRPEQKTADASAAQCRFLQTISAERIRPELNRMLCGEYAAEVLRGCRTELEMLWQSLAQVPMHLWEQTACAFSAACTELTARTALLCGVLDPKEVLRFCPNKETAQMALLAAQNASVSLSADAVSVRRLLNRFGEDVLKTIVQIRLAQAQCDTEKIKQAKAFADLLEKALQTGECYTRFMLAVSGKDAVRAGIRQGENVGKALECLLQDVIEGTLPNRREILLKRLESMAKENI